MGNNPVKRVRIESTTFNSQLICSATSKILIINQGDRVRLKQPFKPESNHSEAYNFGIVVALTYLEQEDGKQIVTGALLRLYNSQTLIVYKDALGTEALFHFSLNEIEMR